MEVVIECVIHFRLCIKYDDHHIWLTLVNS